MRLVRLNIVVAVAYSVTGWLGLRLPYFGEHVTLVWAPAAIALAAIVLAGPAMIPGIYLASFVLTVALEPSHPGPSALIALGNTLGPTAAGLALSRLYALRPQLDHVRDALIYLSIGVFGTSIVTATVGASTLCAFGDASWSEFPTAWFVWLGGDAAGLLIVGPLLLTWLSRPDPTLAKTISTLEKNAMIVSVAIFSAMVLAFGERLVSLPYTFGLFYVWILLRVGPRGSALAIAALAITLVVGTALGAGPFVAQAPRSGMLSLWVFVAAVGSASITASALVAERNRALHHQRLLLSELDHRVKNTLATVTALAERSGDTATDIDDFRERFIGRVRAIARTHEGMARSNWRAMKVEDVVAMTLAPFDGGGPGHLMASGDGTTLGASKVAPVTMVLHELATNAAKYGAWSRPGGCVTVAWARTGDGELRLTWRESGGPALSATPARGYGLGLIEGVIGHELEGRTELDFAATGLNCRLHIPLA